MLEFLLGVSLWPMIMFALFSGACFLAIGTETFVIAVFAFIIYLGLGYVMFEASPAHWMLANPGSVLTLAAVYLAVGIGWSLFKWRRWLVSTTVQDRIRYAYSEYQIGEDNPTRAKFLASYQSAEFRGSENKERITCWMALWPFSMFAFFLGDVLLDLFSYLYDRFAGIYDRITGSAIDRGLK